MNNKKAKAIRKLAKQIAVSEDTTLTKTSTKVFTDFNGNKLPFTTDQVSLQPKGVKYITKMLKRIEGVLCMNIETLRSLTLSEGEARLSELVVKGYK